PAPGHQPLRPRSLHDALPICREEATAALYRLKSALERLEHRRESAQALLERLQADPPLARSPERERLLEEARLARERLGALERKSEEHTSELQSREKLVCRLL